jgi:fatty acid desaturase
MSQPRWGTAPLLDLPNLAVHALWWVWALAFVGGWDALGWGSRAGMWVLGAALLFWNYAVLHNHMHLPVARPPVLKWLVSRSLGLACGFAYRGYSLHHFNHHKYNDGPGDWGQRRPGESPLLYCLRWTVTPWLWPYDIVPKVWQAARTRRYRLELLVDFALVDGSLLALILWRPELGLAYWALLLVGQFGVYWLNVAAHHGTDASHRDMLANTSTSRFYNTFFFNAGFHQAHHLRPQTPWRELPVLTHELEAAGRIPSTLKTPRSPIGARWVATVLRGYSPGPCDPQKDSTITSETPSAAT